MKEKILNQDWGEELLFGLLNDHNKSKTGDLE